MFRGPRWRILEGGKILFRGLFGGQHYLHDIWQNGEELVCRVGVVADEIGTKPTITCSKMHLRQLFPAARTGRIPQEVFLYITSYQLT